MPYLFQIHSTFLLMFTPHEFALWVALREPLSSELLGDMPLPSQGSANSYFAEVIRLLHARGEFESPQFYCDLLEVRPRKAAEIAMIAGLFKQTESVALARELARHVQNGPPPLPTTGRRDSTQAMRIHRLALAIRQRGRLAAMDPRRRRCDVIIHQLGREILAVRVPAPRDGDTQVHVRVPGRPGGDAVNNPGRGPRAGPVERDTPQDRKAAAIVVPAGLQARTGEPVTAPWVMSGLMVATITMMVTLLVGAMLLLAGHDVYRRFRNDDAQPGEDLRSSEDLEAPPATAPPSIVLEPDTALEVEPRVEPRRPDIRKRKPAKLVAKRAASGPTMPVMPRVPLPPQRLAVQAVAATLGGVIRPSMHRDLSIRMAVLPDGTVDRTRIMTSSVYGDLTEDIAALRFPPTRTGSGEVFCSVVSEGDPTTTRPEGRVHALKCRPD